MKMRLLLPLVMVFSFLSSSCSDLWNVSTTDVPFSIELPDYTPSMNIQRNEEKDASIQQNSRSLAGMPDGLDLEVSLLRASDDSIIATKTLEVPQEGGRINVTFKKIRRGEELYASVKIFNHNTIAMPFPGDPPYEGPVDPTYFSASSEAVSVRGGVNRFVARADTVYLYPFEGNYEGAPSDNNSGLYPHAPVASFNRAKEVLGDREGTIYVMSPITLRSETPIDGEGVITLKKYTNTDVFTWNDSVGTTIKNITIDGNKEHLKDSSNSLIAVSTFGGNLSLQNVAMQNNAAVAIGSTVADGADGANVSLNNVSIQGNDIGINVPYASINLLGGRIVIDGNSTNLVYKDGSHVEISGSLSAGSRIGLSPTYLQASAGENAVLVSTPPDNSNLSLNPGYFFLDAPYNEIGIVGQGAGGSANNLVLQKFPVITFDTNGGKGTMQDQVIRESSAMLNRNTFTRDGYAFIGWSGESGNELPIYMDGENVTSSSVPATLYASWLPIGVYAAGYTVSGDNFVEPIDMRADGTFVMTDRKGSWKQTAVNNISFSSFGKEDIIATLENLAAVQDTPVFTTSAFENEHGGDNLGFEFQSNGVVLEGATFKRSSSTYPAITANKDRTLTYRDRSGASTGSWEQNGNLVNFTMKHENITGEMTASTFSLTFKRFVGGVETEFDVEFVFSRQSNAFVTSHEDYSGMEIQLSIIPDGERIGYFIMDTGDDPSIGLTSRGKYTIGKFDKITLEFDENQFEGFLEGPSGSPWIIIQNRYYSGVVN